MATKNDPGEFDCYGAAEPDEPLFILRANDPLAPGIVRQWANRYHEQRRVERRILGAASQDTAKVRRKIEEAQRCARTMTAWWKERYDG